MNNILILANDNSTIYNFRRELLLRFLEDGYTVIVSVPSNERNKVFINMGCIVEETSLSRFGTNPLREILLIRDYVKLIERTIPDIVLTYTAKPNIYGSFACQKCNVPYINNITGLGSAFQSNNLLKVIMLLLQKRAYKKSQCVFFQNASNKQYFEKKRVVNSCGALLPGSGVNLSQHQFENYPENDERIRFITVSRIRKDKGFDELFEAIKTISLKTDKVEFHIVGWYEDDEYQKKIEYMQTNYSVKYHGNKTQDEVHQIVSKCHCIIHPSYHEGMANVLLEAAATGRPILASKIPGCEETFDEGITGLCFEVKNVKSLVETIMRFTDLPYAKKKNMGIAGRNKMENEFDRQIVVDAYVNKINRAIKDKENL